MKLKILLFALILNLNLYANQEEIKNKPKKRPDIVGLFYAQSKLPYKDIQDQKIIAPYAIFNYKRFSFRGIRAAYRLTNSWPSLSLSLSPQFFNLDPKKGGPFLEGVQERKGTANIGFILDLPTKLAIFSLGLDHDILGRHSGSTASLSIMKPFKISLRLRLRTSLSINYFSKKFSNYYYGVSDQEVDLSKERTKYEVNGAWTFVPSVSLNFFLTRNITTGLRLAHSFFDKEIYRSPLVDKKSASTIAFSAGYLFY